MKPNTYKTLLLFLLSIGIYTTAWSQCATGQFTTFGFADNPANSGSEMNPANCSFNFEICFDVTTFEEIVMNQLHGIYIFNSPPNGTMTVTMGAGGGEQPAVGGGFNWIFLDDTEISNGGFVDLLGNPLEPGFYVDDGDGDPTNNLGDTGDGVCNTPPCTETFTTLAPFCFNVAISGCTTGSYRPGMVVSGDGETGSNIGLVNPVCYSLGYLPGQDPADELGPNCDGFMYFSTNAGVTNDLPTTAENIDALISSAVSNAWGWACDASPRTFFSPSEIPLIGNVENDDTGADICDATAKNDRWYSFTGGEDVWVDIFRGNNVDEFVIALYSGIPNTEGCEITGLTYIDCADNGFGFGGARDVGECTSPIVDRIDVSGLNSGETYYLRVWQDGTTIPENADFYFSVEKSTPLSPGVDNCSGIAGPTIGCLNGDPDVNVSETYLNLSNVGTLGNSDPSNSNCDPTNGVAHAGTVVGIIDYDCDGGFVTPVGFTNNVVNNNVMYAFEVNGSVECEVQASVQLTFDNVAINRNTGFLQIVVTPADCATGAAVMTASVDPNVRTCFIMQTQTGILPNGLYIISCEGQDAGLISYDLTLDITYSGIAGCVPGDCLAPAPVELDYFKGKNTGSINKLEWMTQSEINTEWHLLERSTDGIDFTEVARQAASGFSDQPRYYSYEDFGAPKEAYYRLKSLDFDGYYEYSHIIHLTRETDQSETISIFPNPAKDEAIIQFHLHKTDKVMIEVYDLFGEFITFKSLEDSVKGLNSMKLNLESYKNGIYFIRIYNGKEYKTEKLIVDKIE